MASNQVLYSPPQLVEKQEQEDEDDDDDSEQLRDTKNAFYQYVFAKAERDSQLSRAQAATFHEAKVELESKEETEVSCDAAEMGRRLAVIGDEVDALYHDEMTEIVQMTGSPERAYRVFVDVVQNLFEWDESTHSAKITLGRLGALLAYAYSLCKHYIQINTTVKLVVTFLGLVTTWLFRFLIKAKFYEWLDGMGGWGKLISDTAKLVSETTNYWGNTLFLMVGISSLLIWGYNVMRNR